MHPWKKGSSFRFSPILFSVFHVFSLSGCIPCAWLKSWETPTQRNWLEPEKQNLKGRSMWWQLNFFFWIFTPRSGEDGQFDEHIFQIGGSTTNQLRRCTKADDGAGRQILRRSMLEKQIHESNWATKKNKRPYFPLNPGWLIGILISWFMKQSLYNWVVCHPLYTLNNQGPFFHCGHLLG